MHGQAALDILRAGTDPTVVLFDLFMPAMDGQQLLQHILADPALAARCTLVCMTASVISLCPGLAALLDAHDFPLLAKPFDIDDLLAAVAAAVDKLPEEGRERKERSSCTRSCGCLAAGHHTWCF